MRTKTTNAWKKVTAVLITLAMALGWVLAPRVALALQDDKTVACLGTSGIEVPNAGWSKGTGSYVYYGTYNGTPTKYRVLANGTTDFGGTTMLLDCDMLLYTSWFDGQNPLTNSWSDSLVRSGLNGSAFFSKDGNLTETEKGAILDTSITESGKTSTDKVFLLSVADVDGGYYAEGYGSDALSARIKSTGVKTDVWWLRSASSYTYSNGDPCAVVVNENGYVVTPGSNASYTVETENISVSPAFNIKLSSVIFSSVISGEAGKPGAEYKLTILDDKLEINPSIATVSSTEVTIPYKISGDNATSATQASYIVLRNSWDSATNEVLNYGKLDPISNAEGTLDLNGIGLAVGGWNNEYYVYVLAENANGAQYTDYASKPKLVELDKPEPTTYTVAVKAEPETGGKAEASAGEAEEGATVTLTATPADGYEFVNWTLTGEGATLENADRPETKLTMGVTDVTVTASFKKKTEPEPTPVAVPDASVTAHVQRIGWMDPVADGGAAGTTGRSRRMEALRLTLPEGVAGGIEYRGHVQRSGWEDSWAADGAQSGTTGKSRRMEAVQVRLTGAAADAYDVYYRVHVQRIGWMAWAKNGEEAGTTGMSRRAEAIQVVLVKKDTPAPDATFKGVTQQYDKAFVQK
ncbi:MAG: DUF6273 domain-containing protein [Coriobacteriales bacterium]|nr:DUF6273 domain-containing protein [Coriobacteriales bacterium]